MAREVLVGLHKLNVPRNLFCVKGRWYSVLPGALLPEGIEHPRLCRKGLRHSRDFMIRAACTKLPTRHKHTNKQNSFNKQICLSENKPRLEVMVGLVREIAL